MATNASGFFKTDYAFELGFWETPWRRFWMVMGLARIWGRMRAYFELWPFKYRTLP